MPGFRTHQAETPSALVQADASGSSVVQLLQSSREVNKASSQSEDLKENTGQDGLTTAVEELCRRACDRGADLVGYLEASGTVKEDS